MCFDVNDGAEVEVTHTARLETTGKYTSSSKKNVSQTSHWILFDGSSLAGLEFLFPLRYVPVPLSSGSVLSCVGAAQYQQNKHRSRQRNYYLQCNLETNMLTVKGEL